jgi:hypothetical protein
MDFMTITFTALAAACLYSCWQAWRDQEPRQDLVILGTTGGAFGIGSIAAFVI